MVSGIALLALGAKHFYRGRGLLGNGAGLHRLFLRNKVFGHGAKLGSRLGLAAAGAERNGAGNGSDESGKFHISGYG